MHSYIFSCSDISERLIPHALVTITPAPVNQAVLLTKVNCSGEENNLSQCQFESLLSETDAPTCHHNEDVILSCRLPGKVAVYILIDI